LLIEGALVVLVLIAARAAISGNQRWLDRAADRGLGRRIAAAPAPADAKRFVLFLIGTALFITIVVEVVVVRGDIGRQNTIFKFYLQAWFMLAVAPGLPWHGRCPPSSNGCPAGASSGRPP
jgi:hypothetical protein